MHKTEDEKLVLTLDDYYYPWKVRFLNDEDYLRYVRDGILPEEEKK